MQNIIYSNTTQDSLDIAILHVSQYDATTGQAVITYPSVAPGNSLAYTPAKSGYYRIATRLSGTSNEYVVDSNFSVQYILPAHITSIRQALIGGFTISEFEDFYKLKLHLTDDMNSDFEVQKYMFEIMYAFVQHDVVDPISNPPEDVMSPIVPKIVDSMVRYDASTLRETKYPASTMFIDDTVEYENEYNNHVRNDIIAYQHKSCFVGDTFNIPKIEGQSIPGNYLVFAIKRRTIGKSNLENSSITDTFVMPINKYTTQQLIFSPGGVNERTEAVEELLTSQGVLSKFDAIQRRTDETPEKMSNKMLDNVMINDTTASRAYVEIPLDGTDNVIKISRVAPGAAGNNGIMRIIASSDPSNVEFGLDGDHFLIAIGSTTTAYELIRALKTDNTVLNEYIIEVDQGSLDRVVLPINPGVNFTGGSDGYVLNATGKDIDEVIEKSPARIDEFVEPVPYTNTLVFVDNPVESDFFEIEDERYTFRKDIIIGGAQATSTLDLTSTIPTDGDTIIIGDITYKLVDAFSDPVAPNEILIGESSAECAENIVEALTGTGLPNVDYSEDTQLNLDVLAVQDGNTVEVIAAQAGFAGNSIVTAGTLTNGSWTTSTLTGGVDPAQANDILIGADSEETIANTIAAINGAEGEGTLYGPGTVANIDVTAEARSDNDILFTSNWKRKPQKILQGGGSLSWMHNEFEGVEGSPVCPIGAIRYDGDFVYIAVGICDEFEQNWKKIAFVVEE